VLLVLARDGLSRNADELPECARGEAIVRSAVHRHQMLANLMERHFLPFEAKDFQSSETVNQYRSEAEEKKEQSK
jgi:hypothetical protein